MSAKRAMASERAKPSIAYWKSCPVRAGLRETPIIRHPKTTPIPAPVPARPMVADPAPINFADCNSIFAFEKKKKAKRPWVKRKRRKSS
jgi:hypothetical protein